MRSWSSKGIGGFMEELPALLVVLVALSVFIAGAANAYYAYVDHRESLSRRERCQAFVGQVLSEPGLTAESRNALFDRSKLEAMSNEEFTARFPSARAGFEYSVEITAPDAAYTAGFGYSPVEAQTKVVIEAPCNILDEEGIVWPGLLRLTAWGFGS
ncbi:MAG: hypothetical protein AB1665_09250 [Candidatus Thermoplasmatota archaeon]